MANLKDLADKSDTLSTEGLDDDKPVQQKEFEGATLEISSNVNDITVTDNNRNISTNNNLTTGSEFRATDSDDVSVNVVQPSLFRSFSNSSSNNVQDSRGLSRNRPGSMIGSASNKSGASRISTRPGVIQSDLSARSFYCYKETHFEKAVNTVKSIIKPELDGELKSSWLLTEIDHWDFEREKIILLTEYSMFIVKYNFINETLYEYRRVMLHLINAIYIGDFQYPTTSLMPDRKHGGIQIRWDKGEQLSFGQKWNPWCSDIPWVTLSHHPLIYNPKESETVTYNVDEFFESIVTAVSKVFTEKRPGEKVKVVEGPILIESYASPASLVFNQGGIGFFRDRNGVSF
ncbi:tumor protein p63-regulated 1-like protein [Biomphalaria pfeifferi]|uniref:Tumor protein p63-regulated 1-like protein n=1 Tax=Biomphalaria pfeifferi TaxID=112525 RepID=A0AAD8FJF2_BIOPF|nr:tumor protein p63-regulated 1-like protein [Biomphalaria pfeifferi]